MQYRCNKRLDRSSMLCPDTVKQKKEVNIPSVLWRFCNQNAQYNYGIFTSYCLQYLDIMYYSDLVSIPFIAAVLHCPYSSLKFLIFLILVCELYCHFTTILIFTHTMDTENLSGVALPPTR